MSQLNSEVAITLNGDDFTLRPTLKAASAISRQLGGLNEAYAALGRVQLDAYVFIVRTGLPRDQLKKFPEESDLANAVWRAGMDNLAEPLARFVNLLRNGGRNPEVAANDEDDEDEGEGASGNDKLHVS